MSPSANNMFETEWILVSPDVASVKKWSLYSFIFAVICGAIACFLESALWQAVFVAMMVGGLYLVTRGIYRIVKNVRLLFKIRFDDRRIERIVRTEPEGRELKSVIAFDGLDKVEIAHETIWFYDASNPSNISSFLLSEFETIELINELMKRIEARGVKIVRG